MTDSSDAKPAVEPAAQQHDTPKPSLPKPGAAAKPGAPKPHPTPTHALSA
ncbi:DUF349 domain-containing protein, partial [Rhodococcus sp. A14]|nr:DUF349 domain-containing protein [Rhodococcus sp. A14]